MPSTFAGLNIAYTGLVASNSSLNTTANNIANIETKGYSRQQVNQTAATAMRAFQGYGCIGAGVDTLGAERIRDKYYDTKYWSNSSKLGEYEKKSYYAKMIENYLMDQKGTNEIKGFRTIYSEYDAAMESLSGNTGEINYALQFIGKSENLCEYFNILYNNFQKIQTDINDEIKIKVDAINNAAQEIASLNSQINTIEVGGLNKANDLRDKRDLVIDNLSKIIDVEVCETPVLDPSSGKETGINTYTVRIAGGQGLVDGYQYRQLECVPRTYWQSLNQNDATGLYDVSWTDTHEDIGMFAKNVKGELKGLFEMRDGNNEEAFNGTVTKVDARNNQVTVEVTDDFLTDMSKLTIPLTNGKIKIAGVDYCYDSWEYQKGTDGNGYYTFNITDDTVRNPKPLDTSLEGQHSGIGEKINYQGIPYYLEQMNEWVRDYSSAFNNIYGVDRATDYYNESKAAGEIFFTGNNDNNNLIEGKQFRLTKALDSETYKSTDDTYIQLTAGNFNVDNEEVNDPRKMSTHTIDTSGVSNYNIINELKELSVNTDKMQFRGCTASEFLVCIMGDSALNTNSADSFVNIYSNIEETIENSRYSVSGVDADEEAANMIKFQNAYNLASKMISVLNECYDRLITQTGV